MYYTYLHRRNDTGAVFYIGKGSLGRAHTSQGRSKFWANVVKKTGHTVEIVAPWQKERDAFDHEVFLISCFRSMGADLVNMTDGGDGMSGHRHTVETKERIRLAAIGKKRSAETRERLSQSCLGRPVSESARAKIGEFHSRRVRAESEYVKQRATNATDETKKRRSDAMRAMLADPATKARMLASRSTSKAFAESDAKRRKPVVCIETGVIYPSLASAADALGLKKTNVSAVCRGVARTAGGFRFRWLQAIDPPPLTTTTTEREVSA